MVGVLRRQGLQALKIKLSPDLVQLLKASSAQLPKVDDEYSLFYFIERSVSLQEPFDYMSRRLNEAMVFRKSIGK
jgi:hypothetical protein